MKAWGRFTMRGGSDVEIKATALTSQAADIIQTVLRPEQYRAVILVGGYGRGEGGIERSATEERLHDNFDFWAIVNSDGSRDLSDLKSTLDERLQPLSEGYGVGLAIRFVAKAQLSNFPLGYDMRFGHKIVLGGDHFTPSLPRLPVNKTVSREARDWMVNHGTLLLINEALLERGNLSAEEKIHFVKNALKCIAGYGDALLFFLGDYHWSYAEKQKRMKNRTDIDSSFRRVYDEALEFCFEADYAAFLNRDFSQWMEDLWLLLAPIHCFCESRRLSQPALSWKTYPEKAFRQALLEEIGSLRDLPGKVMNVFRGGANAGMTSWLGRLGGRCSGIRERLPILFPAIAYRLQVESYLELTRVLLNSRSNDFNDLRSIYLRKWSLYGDEHFTAAAPDE
jgi:hypothetical protein